MKALNWILIGLLSIGVGCGRITKMADSTTNDPAIEMSAQVVGNTVTAIITASTDRHIVFPRSRAIYRVELINLQGEAVTEVPVIGLSVAKAERVGPATPVTDSVELPDHIAGAVAVRVLVSAQLDDGTVLQLVQRVSLL